MNYLDCLFFFGEVYWFIDDNGVYWIMGVRFKNIIVFLWVVLEIVVVDMDWCILLVGL